MNSDERHLSLSEIRQMFTAPGAAVPLSTLKDDVLWAHYMLAVGLLTLGHREEAAAEALECRRRAGDRWPSKKMADGIGEILWETGG